MASWILLEVDDLLWQLRLGRPSKSDLLRCAELHYVAQLSAEQAGRLHPAPYAIVKVAARYMARDSALLENGLGELGRDIIRYQVWRGRLFLDAFKESYDVGRRSRRFRDTFASELTAALDRSDEVPEASADQLDYGAR